MIMDYSPWVEREIWPFLKGSNISETGEVTPTKIGVYVYSMVTKKFNCLESAQKIMQVGVDVTCINTNFGGCDLSGFGDIATFKNGQFSLSTHVL